MPPIYTEDVTAVRFVRSSDSTCELPCGQRVSRQQDRRPGQQHLTPSPHLTPPSSPRTHKPFLVSPPSSPTASHRAGQQPSEEPGRIRGDGQAISGVNSRTRRRTSWTDSSLWREPTAEGNKVEAVILKNTFFGWCFVFAASPRCLCFVVSRVSRWMGSLVGRRVCIGGLLLFVC